MTQLHDGLALYREQLHDAIERDLARDLARAAGSRRRQRRAIALAIPASAAAAAAGLALTLSGGAAVPSADAAILHHVATALAPPPGTILYERAMVSIAGQPARPFELWAQSDAPQTYRVIKGGHEATVTTTKVADYNAQTNTITDYSVDGLPPSRRRHQGPEDFAATLRALVQSGQATVDATASYDGVPAYKLTVTGASDRFLNGTAYVAASDYKPLEIDTTGNGGEVIRYTAYQYLPATAANLRLLDVAAAHPSARIVSAAG